MEEREVNYTPTNGAKIEYGEDTPEVSSWTRIYGLLNIPAIGEEPNKISTTTLDNETYETEVDGLMPAPKLSFEFNMEDPDTEANINIVHKLAESKKIYKWKITKANGVIHTYRSKVKYGFKEEESDNISGFTMYHSPIGEIENTIPNGAE